MARLAVPVGPGDRALLVSCHTCAGCTMHTASCVVNYMICSLCMVCGCLRNYKMCMRSLNQLKKIVLRSYLLWSCLSSVKGHISLKVSQFLKLVGVRQKKTVLIDGKLVETRFLCATQTHSLQHCTY